MFCRGGNLGQLLRLWRDLGGPAVAVAAYQPRGRDSRWHEPRAGLSATVAEATAALIESAVEERLVLVGHSYGALVAYEVAQALRGTAVRVDHLVVMARPAPFMAPHTHLVADMPDAELVATLRAIGLEDKGILSHPGLAHLFLDTLRHDLRENHDYVHLHARPLDCPITAFSGARDPIATPLSMANWAACTSAAFRHLRMPGAHFFPVAMPHRMVRLFSGLLEGKT
ncbi:MAG: alpha/beta fold hydrolase [Defluviimonas denitrificans]